MAQAEARANLVRHRIMRGWKHSDPAIRFFSRLMLMGLAGALASVLFGAGYSWQGLAFSLAFAAGFGGLCILKHLRRTHRMMGAACRESSPGIARSAAWALVNGDLTLRCGYALLLLAPLLLLLPAFSGMTPPDGGGTAFHKAEFGILIFVLGAMLLRVGQMGKARDLGRRPAAWRDVASVAMTAFPALALGCGVVFMAWSMMSQTHPVQTGPYALLLLMALSIITLAMCRQAWVSLTQKRDRVHRWLKQRRKTLPD